MSSLPNREPSGTVDLSALVASAVEQAAEAIVITTIPNGSGSPEILFVNAAFGRLTGYQAGEFIGRSLRGLSGPGGDGKFESRLAEAHSRSRPFTAESLVCRKDGTEFLAEWDVAPVLGDGGQVTHFVAILRDLTEWRQTRAELLEAKALAEAADHAKSAFLASMSHELRTPLNAIIGFSELLEEQVAGPLNERQQKYLHNVVTGGRSLLDLIEQVLDLTRADVGQMVVHRSRFSLRNAIQDVQPLVHAVAERKHLILTIDIPETLPLIQADARKLKQVLYTLISSAIRTASDGGELVIGAGHRAGEDSDWFDITVSRRRGDPEEDRRHSEDFDRTTATTNINQPDSGLGLALSRRLVELHGGRLTAEAMPDGGLLYRMSLPAVPNDPVGAPARREAIVTLAPGPLILVVEDNPEASDLLMHYLSTSGYSVARAFTGEEGIRMARQLRPAAITMDSELPDRNGLEVVEALRQDETTRGIPVVVVSVIDRQRGVPAGAVCAWLVKPVDRRQLVGVLRQVINGAAVP